MIKKAVLNSCRVNIENNNPDFTSEKIEEVLYGLEIIYILVVKVSFILIVSYFLGMINSVLLLMAFFGLSRVFGFGVHASNGTVCLIVSTGAFLLLGYFSPTIEFSLIAKIIIGSACLITYAIYAPADTEKRPLINKRKRLMYKLLALSICISMIIVAVLIDNVLISTTIILALIMESFVISPLAYKLLNVKYKNYEDYA